MHKTNQLPNKIYFKIVYLCTQRTNTITQSKNEIRKLGEKKEGGQHTPRSTLKSQRPLTLGKKNVLLKEAYSSSLHFLKTYCVYF